MNAASNRPDFSELLPVLPSSESGLSACGNKDYVIAEELAVLRRMRAIRSEVDPLLSELRSLPAEESPERRRALEAQIESHRSAFRAAREELKAANRIKMIRLGHITE